MKRFLLTVYISAFIIPAIAQDTALRVVNWNIEWFGSVDEGPANNNLQEQNVLRILRYLDADVYALNEVVDTMRLRRVVDSLGNNYSFVVSDYCSIVASPDYPAWLTCQKLAYIYRKDVVTNVRVRGMLRPSQNAYYNFASGRFPYLLNANINKNGKKRNINFINIHAKAGSTSTDYTRRRNAAIELKDTLDQYFTNTPVIILGDLNDELHRSISGFSTSPYQVIVVDSNRSSANYYHAITLPLSLRGENSTISFLNVIDHQVINKKMDSMYIPNSAAIRKDVITVVPEYLTRNTSDHYPVFARFSLVAGDTSVAITPPPVRPPVVSITGYKVGPNPFTTHINFATGRNLSNASFVLYNAVGSKVWQKDLNVLQANSSTQFTLPATLPPGIYLLQLLSKEENQLFKLVK